MIRRRKKWHECNVAQIEGTGLHLWQFNASDPNVSLKVSHAFSDEKGLSKQVRKDWRNLFRSKLNIARISERHIFLRAIQLPECAPDELESMLEFQIEKLSPSPVGQIEWTYECIPSGKKGQMTIILILAQSEFIEQQLNGLEAKGYLADRLEMAWSHELMKLDRSRDQVWIRLGKSDEGIVALVAWVLDQTICNAMILRLPEAEKGALLLIEQLDQTAWTGEVEGWLSEIPLLVICGENDFTNSWKSSLQAWSSHPVLFEKAHSQLEMASLSARCSTRGESNSNLIPKTYHTRYRQKYIDGMWGQGIGVMILFYIFGVIIYFGALMWMEGEVSDLQKQLRSTAPLYTNVLKMQARIDILEDQIQLRFSALDSLLTITENLPEGMTLGSFKFQTGKTLSLSGKVLSSEGGKVTEYHRALINARSGDQKRFASISAPSIQATRSRGGDGNSQWSFTCELERSDF